MSADEFPLVAGEELVWSGTPDRFRFAAEVFRLREVGVYALVVIGLQIYDSVERGEGVVGAAPSVLIVCAAFAVFALLGWRMARKTVYVVTTRRVVARYGVAMPATLSLPYSRVAKISLSLGRRGTGDLLLDLKSGERVPFLKLWPLAFGFWRRAGPQPLLRAVPDAAVVGGLCVRAAFAASSGDRLRLQAVSGSVQSRRNVR